MLAAHRSAVLDRRLVKHQARAAKHERDAREHDHDALQHDEWRLLAEELASVAVLQLRDAVHAARQDEDARGHEAAEKGDAPPRPELGAGAAGSRQPDHVVGKGDHEERNDNDLQDQAGHGDVDAGAAAVVLRRRERAANGLQDQAHDVKGDEDPVEQLRLDAREVGGKVADRLGEGDVDGRGEEDGGDCEADCACVSAAVARRARSRTRGLTDLNHESVVGKGIVPHHDAAHVAQNLGHAAQQHARHEAPAAPAHAKVRVHGADERKQDEKDDVGRQRRAVAKHGPFDGAVVEVAGRVGPKEVFGALIHGVCFSSTSFYFREILLVLLPDF